MAGTVGRPVAESLGHDPSPIGIVTVDQDEPTNSRMLAFLFTDVEGSTRLWERYPDGMRASLARHDAILRHAVQGADGAVVKMTGDGVMAVFDTARNAVTACLTAQIALQGESWGETGPLRVRMGLHVGEASGDGSDYHGQAVNRAARIMAAGHGGQALLSNPTAALVMDRLPEGASLRDLGEHRLRDLSRPERVFQLLHPELPVRFPPLTTMGERVRTLPEEPSVFVGRTAEQLRIGRYLEDKAVRLLTLTGPGGIGKTRLALHAARDAQDHFSAGAVFIDLSAARDSTTLLTTINRELGFPDASEDAQLAELTEQIGHQQLLTVMDNFEQVTSASPILARLLKDCPELKLLVTSREALHVSGERLFAVPPMGLPEATLKVATAERVEGFEAVRLFVERARAVRPDFRVTDDNAATVAEICRRLEGLPLAIELATARLRVFSLEALLDRLGSRLSILGSGTRELPERQQTLRATIEWSYQLLTPQEQRLFEVLACFHGADVEAVESVARSIADRVPGIDPIDGLISLVDKSLLRQSDREGEEPRFEMLESVQEYATERLDTDAELASRARSAHAAYYAQWASQRGLKTAGPERSTALRELARELENLRAAWRLSTEGHDLERLEVFMRGLWPLHDANGWYRGLTDLASDVLALLEVLPTTPERTLLAITLRSNQARALTAMQGYTTEVQTAYEGLLGSLKGAEVPQAYPVLRGLASFYMLRNEHAKAADLGRRIVRLGELQDDPLMSADGHLVLGTSRGFGGRLEDSIPDVETSVRMFEANAGREVPFRLGPNPWVVSLTALSLLLWWLGRTDRSLERSQQAAAAARALAHPSTSGYALFHAGLLRLWRGEPAEARALSVQVIEVAEEHELHVWKAVGTALLGASAVALNVGDEGFRWISEGLAQYRDLRTPPVFWPFLLQLKAQACVQGDRIAEGLGAVDEALALAPVMPDLYIVRGDLLLATGAAAAEAAYERALEVAHAWGARTSELRAAIRLYRSARDTDPAVRVDRSRRLRDILETLTEDQGTPDILEARDLLLADA